jgi:transposase-like protein
MKKQTICPHCNTNNIKKNGSRQTQNRGKIQRFQCKSCSYRFTKDEGFFRMRNNPKKITASIDLFFGGLSTRKVQAHLKAFFPHNCTNMTVYNWVIKYSKKISTFTDGLKLEVGCELQIDEQSHNRVGEQNWLIDSIDTKTRFVVASSFHKSRGQEEIKGVLSMAKQKTLSQFQIVTSDGFLAYPRAIKDVFKWSNSKRDYNVSHNVKKGCDGNGFNVPIERFHNNVRDRTKIMRGFHGSVESADSILKGYVIYYNFIRKHQGLNCSPCELATDLKLKNPNRWIELIEMASQSL